MWLEVPKIDLLSSLKTGCHAGSNLQPHYIGGQAVDIWIGVNIVRNKAKIEKKKAKKNYKLKEVRNKLQDEFHN